MIDPRRRTAMLQATLALAGVLLAGVARADPPLTGAPGPGLELSQVQVQRLDSDLVLDYTVRLELPQDVEDALNKGIAVVFVARAEVFRERWYWTDKARATAERRWRISYQPLTRRWRVTLNGLSQNFNTLGEALSVMKRGRQWRIMEGVPAHDDRGHYVEFSFELDRNELPRPLQIGMGTQSDWALTVFRRVPLSLSR